MPSVEFYESLRPEPSGDVAAVTQQVGVAAGENPGSLTFEREYRWRLKADNGEIIATGESHSRRIDAERAFWTVADALGAGYLRSITLATSSSETASLIWRWSEGDS